MAPPDATAAPTEAQPAPPVAPPAEAFVHHDSSSSNPNPNALVSTPDHPEIFMVQDQDEDMEENERQGSISSARFNILSTMVGGGCLSLPLAFQQSGNGLLGPVLLVVTGLVSDFMFRLLVTSSVRLEPPDSLRPGKHSFESISAAAFGPKAYILSMGLVTAMCLFGAVGYAVLLRDMMEPLNDWLSLDAILSSAWLKQNFTMFAIVLLVTPATTLQTFTALKNCGAASMMSVLILGSCIVVRSFQCNWNAPQPWYTYVSLWPESPEALLDAIPLYISCFVCHYNILPVHNELQDPTPARVSWWLRSTTWYAVGLYLIMGFAGSSYGHCTESGHVQGNVLLDFPEDDPLLMVGRMCLALTITLAFPMLVIPARDILLRSVILPYWNRRRAATNNAMTSSLENHIVGDSSLQEPLLADEEPPQDEEAHAIDSSDDDENNTSVSFLVRLLTSIAIFWTAAAVASCVESIDVVWDLLGSSLSILLSFLIPCGSYLVLCKPANDDDQSGRHQVSRLLCWILLGIFGPLMVVSTSNAVRNTFFVSE